MVSCDGLLTEFKSNTIPDKPNFPVRNRIVAGISDAIIVSRVWHKMRFVNNGGISKATTKMYLHFPEEWMNQKARAVIF